MGARPHRSRRQPSRDCAIPRRAFLAAGGAAFAALTLPHYAIARADEAAFSQRGYYITFMRMPTFGLAAWKSAVDCFTSDNINVLVLWMAGGFGSKKFPITWRYNAEHENVRSDFAGDLIRYAQGKGIKVLLGFTPFGYDGVNQYAIEHPQLKARKKDGSPVDPFGIHCWGWNLCPSKAESQQFMREYVHEMFFDFYPQADGLLIESSDYAICHCADCAGRFYDREFELINAISAEVWQARRDATIVVYPHYFSGTKVPGMDAQASHQPFDPRWTLFFTPHSAHLDDKLIGKARASLWSDDAPALHDPATIALRARQAKDAHVTGYLPSLEAFSYITTHVEEGRQDLIGQRQVPFGFGWLKAGEMPYSELPIRINRIAFREFSNESSLAMEQFRQRLARDIFGAGAIDAAWVDDLLLLNRVFFDGKTWCQPAPAVSPPRVRIDLKAGRITAAGRAQYRATLQALEALTRRHSDAPDPARTEMHRIGAWILKQWSPADLRMLETGLV